MLEDRRFMPGGHRPSRANAGCACATSRRLSPPPGCVLPINDTCARSPAMHSFHWLRCGYQPPHLSRNLRRRSKKLLVKKHLITNRLLSFATALVTEPVVCHPGSSHARAGRWSSIHKARWGYSSGPAQREVQRPGHARGSDTPGKEHPGPAQTNTAQPSTAAPMETAQFIKQTNAAKLTRPRPPCRPAPARHGAA